MFQRKLKLLLKKNLLDELKYFQKKYSYEVKILSNSSFVIPEYKIDLLNKSKKLINTIENINPIMNLKNNKPALKKEKKEKKNELSKTKDKTKKTKIKKKIRTLWVRRKKKLN